MSLDDFTIDHFCPRCGRFAYSSSARIARTHLRLTKTKGYRLNNGTEYVDRGQDYYEQQYRERVVKNLRKRAEHLDFALIPSLDRESP